VKQLLVAALNRKDREREQVSQLLVQLHPNVSGCAGARALGREQALWAEAAAAGPRPTHCHPALAPHPVVLLWCQPHAPLCSCSVGPADLPTLALDPQVLSTEQLTLGFTRLLHAADDLVLDIPDAVHLLALFLGRAIVDEILPPAALTQVGVGGAGVWVLGWGCGLKRCGGAVHLVVLLVLIPVCAFARRVLPSAAP